MLKALKNLPPYKLAILALVISNVIWGAAPPIFKLALTSIPPFSLAFLRFFIPTLLLLPFLNQKKYFYVARKHWPDLLGNAFFGVTGNISFFFLGLKLAPSINASIIATSASIFTTLLAALFLKEKVLRRVFLGNLVGFLGVSLIVFSPFKLFPLQVGLPEMVGNIFFVIATLSASAQVITSRKLGRNYSSRTFTFYTFLIGFVSFLPMASLEYWTASSWPTQLRTPALLGIIYGAFFSSFIAYTIWGYAAEKITASEIGLYMYLDPLVTIIFANYLLGEKITLSFAIGALLTLSGIYLAERRVAYVPYHNKSHRKIENCGTMTPP